VIEETHNMLGCMIARPGQSKATFKNPNVCRGS